MKKIYLVIFTLLLGLTTFGQVGINTTNPTSTLDVNGTIRVRGIKQGAQNQVQAVRLVGLDEQGNMIEVEIDKNVILENNRLRAIDRENEIGDAGFGLPILNNVNLIILPGEPNHNKKIMRIRNILGNSILTGLVPGVDGQQVYIYPVDGSLTIFTNSLLSLFGARIEGNGNIQVKQYEILELMYDATRNKWIPIGVGF